MNIFPFENYTSRYEDWFEKNKYAYQSELEAVKSMLPQKGLSLDIGAGTGRFSIPFNISVGVDPSKKMLSVAKEQGLLSVCSVAEKLPFKREIFDFALMVTSICFVDDILKVFKEAFRVLKSEGYLIIGFVDKDSPIGKKYYENRDKSVFYKSARFYSANEVVGFLKSAGFSDFRFCQTLFSDNIKNMKAPDTFKKGFGEGSFVVIRAKK